MTLTRVIRGSMNVPSVGSLALFIFLPCACSPGLMEEADASGGTSGSRTTVTSNGTGGANGSTGGIGGATVGTAATTVTVSTEDCPDNTTPLNQAIASQYGGVDVKVTDSSKTYHVATNWWKLFEDQSITVTGLGFTIHNSSNVSVSQSEGSPIGYPTIFIGSYAGSTTVDSNLPKQVSTLSSVHTVFDTNALALDTSNFNAAYDVWFTASSSPLPSDQYNPGTGGAYLMVWLFDPADRQPRGSKGYPAHAVSGLDGTWDVWIDATDPPCITYVRTDPLSALAFDLNAFIQDSVSNGYGITSQMYLSIVFAGFEVWGGGDGLALNQFCAIVE